VTHNYYGQYVNQQNSNNPIGMINNNYASADPQAAFRDLVNAVQVLRGQVSPDERQAIDESMRVIQAGKNAEPQRLRKAFTSISGIALLAGQVGPPVVDAVKKLMAAVGI
jgi:hypothetical protein